MCDGFSIPKIPKPEQTNGRCQDLGESMGSAPPGNLTPQTEILNYNGTLINKQIINETINEMINTCRCAGG